MLKTTEIMANSLSQDVEDVVHVNAIILRSAKRKAVTEKRASQDKKAERFKFLDVVIPVKKKYNDKLFNKEFNWLEEKRNDLYCKKTTALNV